jgi:hypothetical protein
VHLNPIVRPHANYLRGLQIMSWRTVGLYAIGFLAMRVGLGLLEGFFFPGTHSIVFGLLASFLAATAFFANFSRRHSARPFLQAFSVLFLNFAGDLVLYRSITWATAEIPYAFLALSWLVLLVGSILGTQLGVVLSRRRVVSANVA